jgi:3-deoxy-D-manno-octulosonic-acid transferase
MYFLYSLILAFGAVCLAPFALLKNARASKEDKNLPSRFGRIPPDILAKSEGCIWLHAVSVGEALAALPFARKLKETFPNRSLLISTVTVTGQRIARERFDFADGVFYFPFDWAWVTRRVLRAVRPHAVIVVETEIWPNFLREAHRAGVPMIFANGRISDRSFRRHERLLKLGGFVVRGFYRKVLANANLFLMQSESDAARVKALGAPADRVVVTGNLKYDSQLPPVKPIEEWLANVAARKNRRPLIVAGSVTAGEEPLVLIAFGVLQGQMPNALLVLAPRKPDRFDAAAQHIEESQREYLRRSAVNLGHAGADDALTSAVSVLLLDSIGELAGLYRLADAVFVGGSLVPAGGHNILEPAGFGKPPVFGPSMENFQDVASTFLSRGAARQVHSPEDLGVAWIEMVQDRDGTSRMGDLARKLMDENRGATERTLQRVVAALGAEPAPEVRAMQTARPARSQDGA